MDPPRIVIVGAGFAGFSAARRLRRLLGRDAEIVVVNTTNYFLYTPLLPQAAGGVLDPRLSIPGNRLRIASEWLLEAVLPRQTVQLGLVGPKEVPLETASPETPMLRS